METRVAVCMGAFYLSRGLYTISRRHRRTKVTVPTKEKEDEDLTGADGNNK